MNHQALARKWRPRDFGSLVGQEHVVRALAHALDTGRLHHAYLFTGTRGVGKTTIARILAKALNCETGVGSKPCGNCAACTGIDAGRFVDCIELDAASNRGVDEMTQLLENAVYAPTVGRYKVYVIDEVHMLSNHAFNAMLKTLEEPPPHVVFVLATTDPQKVPVTVLSRCLQFNLKNMPPALVAGHLQRVLQAEEIACEPAALEQIGRAAAGSMRDALSLLDQAIAFSGGEPTEASVREMLGVVDRAHLERIVDALLARDGVALVAQADAMLETNVPFEPALAELAMLMQRIALVQAGVPVPGEDEALLARLAGQLPPEEVQVHYQIAIHGQRDLPLAPDPHTGFTMTLLRMLAFRPDESPERPAGGAPRARAQALQVPAGSRAVSTAGSRAVSTAGPRVVSPARSAARPPWEADPALDIAAAPSASPVVSAPESRRDKPVQVQASSAHDFDGDWPALVERVQASGMAAQFLRQSELIGHEGLQFRVRVPIRPLAEASTVNRAREALSRH
ncbi:MAG TPA: DNA polymerase III subunit gamma/tau, partial [Burkholderiaceae bacterium]|nr:DNA polymerase III subunit gamma/tau [Burkholderiaceae bacterium]